MADTQPATTAPHPEASNSNAAVPGREAAALDALLAQRHSCRAFQPTPVPEQTIREILRIAQRTASWCNSQPWQVIITGGDETDRFREALLRSVTEVAGTFDIDPPARYEGVYSDRRRASGFALYNSLGITREDTEGKIRQGMENFRFFGAPHLAIVTSEADLGGYGLIDCGGYIANFLLAAASLGVASIAQAAIANYSNVVREHFAIPEHRRVLCGISFGYSDPEHPANSFRTDRAEVEDMAEFRGFLTS